MELTKADSDLDKTSVRPQEGFAVAFTIGLFYYILYTKFGTY